MSYTNYFRWSVLLYSLSSKPYWFCGFWESTDPCVSLPCKNPLGDLFANILFTVYLTGAALLFAIGQIFQYVISVHLCEASSGAINGTLFETLFTLLAVIGVWAFWSSITEDDWPLPVGGGYN